MKKLLASWLFLSVVAGLAALAAPLSAAAASNGRWLHVRIEKTGEDAEHVRVNIPLAVAIKVLPAISSRELKQGRLKLHDVRVQGVDLRQVLEAIRSLDDGEFVTVESNNETVRVAKQGGYLLAKVDERTGSQDKIDVKIPFRVVEALLSGGEDELNLLAAVEALSQHEDEVLVKVDSGNETIRVWVDSKSTAE